MEPHAPPSHLSAKRDRELWRGAVRVLMQNHCGTRFFMGEPVRVNHNGKGLNGAARLSDKR